MSAGPRLAMKAFGLGGTDLVPSLRSKLENGALKD